MRIGFYPGSFDPITYGHIDIVNRGAKLFDKLYVAISCNPNKKTMFTDQERLLIVKEVLKDIPNVEVIKSDILTVEHCKQLGATHILRGLRAVTDYDYEFQLTNFNRQISNDIDTVFLMTEGKYSFLSSSSVRELAIFKGDVTPFVPKVVQEAILKKIK
ncbi:MAG: pantetheine-phosphate adenylyltransferase [Candidatus Izemoplasmatales bacterium]|jgi:pantetheine-phosphate adenylyltransferase|nr:pantetheine-phosphate adenylyltransferase [Candidatus Izemoplasmatales bacterium]MDD4595317.1 pantetheine-phosphate adenylyltransferase [Candidatus Izemoplasmatales bacterium]